MSNNPLIKHFRTPSIFIKLPSQGHWWTEGSIEMPASGELPVLPLTTRDEILLRTPDALLNGEGVVRVIESCCPSIKDAWKMPSIDVDTALISIRIASYGAEMPIVHKCPHCNESNDYEINLHNVLATVQTPKYQEFETHGLKIKLKPQPYFSNNESKKLAFEEQQMLRFIADDSIEGEERSKMFQERLNKLVDLTIKSLSDSTDYVETEDGTRVTDVRHIAEFYENADQALLAVLREKLKEVQDQVDIKPLDMMCPDCSKPSKVGIDFDYASFFAKGS